MNLRQSILAELRYSLKTRFMRVLLILAPLFLGLVCGWIFVARRVPQKLPVAVWQRDDGRISRDLLRFLESNIAFSLQYRVSDFTTGKALLVSGKVRGFLVIPEDFSERLKRRQQARLILYEDFNFLLPGRTLHKNMYKVESWLQNTVLKEYFRETKGLDDTAAGFFSEPVAVNYRKLFNPPLEYTQFLLPGILFTLMFQVLAVLGGCVLFTNREALAGSSRHRFLLVKVIAHTILSLIPFTILYLLLFPLFGLAMGNPLKILGFYLLFSTSTLLLGMFVSTLTRNAVLATELMIILGAAGFTFSGFTWPRMVFIPLFRWGVYMLPITSFLEESSKIWYGSVLHTDVGPLLLLLVVLAGLTALFIRRLDHVE